MKERWLRFEVRIGEGYSKVMTSEGLTIEEIIGYFESEKRRLVLEMFNRDKELKDKEE